VLVIAHEFFVGTAALDSHLIVARMLPDEIDHFFRQHMTVHVDALCSLHHRYSRLFWGPP
jgi:hypothetical protein